jgi:hypothetical protein
LKQHFPVRRAGRSLKDDLAASRAAAAAANAAARRKQRAVDPAFQQRMQQLETEVIQIQQSILELEHLQASVAARGGDRDVVAQIALRAHGARLHLRSVQDLLEEVRFLAAPASWAAKDNGAKATTAGGAAAQSSTSVHPSDGIELRALRLRDALIQVARGLPLPPNPIDELIGRLGGTAAVAELTGRRIRPAIASAGDDGEVSSSAPNSSGSTSSPSSSSSLSSSSVVSSSLASPSSSARGALGRLLRTTRASDASGVVDPSAANHAERHNFMSGRKHIALISSAASTGISLHNDAVSAAKNGDGLNAAG